ncbi:unnamed protein product [Cochlearia groenlandica]
MNPGDEFSELQEPENHEQQQSDEGDETIPASTSHEPPSTTNQSSTSRREPVINEGYGFFEREETEDGGHITQQQSEEGGETIPASTSHEQPSTTNQASTIRQEFEDQLLIEFYDFEALDDAHKQSFISENNINTGRDVGFNELMQIAEQKSFISEKIPASTSQGPSWTNQEPIKMPFMSMTQESKEEIKMIPTPGFNAHGSSSSLTNVLGQGHNSPSYLEEQTQAINATSTSRNQESAWSIKKRLTKTDISRGWVLLDKSSVMDHIKDHLSSQHNLAKVVEGMPGVELRRRGATNSAARGDSDVGYSVKRCDFGRRIFLLCSKRRWPVESAADLGFSSSAVVLRRRRTTSYIHGETPPKLREKLC